MQSDKLPQFDFSLNADITMADVLYFPENKPVGYFLEIDSHYSASPHDYHQDFKNFVEDDWFSKYQVNLREL